MFALPLGTILLINFILFLLKLILNLQSHQFIIIFSINCLCLLSIFLHQTILICLNSKAFFYQECLPYIKEVIQVGSCCPKDTSSFGLIGFRSQFISMTSGTGILTHVFDHFGEVKGGEISGRNNGVLVSMITGKALGYALFNLQERGRLMIDPNVDIYEGQIVGIHSRGNDLPVNPTKAKQLTNVRASGSDENILLTPPVKMSLEQALEFVEDDELVEVTPTAIRVRKKLLKEHERKRASRDKNKES